ncbi:DUF1453 domain-containing protein [Streptomyces fuscigenes]|uniref:DUF1453 domain-containing protein n=1 Tax=Streptomyces fuscigenes TaxID=1528880 RepID=UPI001F2C91D7|nr:DUF1453 domain-containing protein [Streptomyces fuscigenes]MCF3962367.1 DUF1453 domain-containing protein [Streptomyces fuscigenes]
MDALLYALVIVGVIVLLVARQARPQRIGGGDRKWLVMPVIMVILGLRQGHIVDAHHSAVSTGLLAAELVVGVLMGFGWAFTSRVWTEADGSRWSRGTKGTAAVWLGGMAARVGIMGLGALAGVHQSEGALLITLGVSFALRSLLLMHRAGALSSRPAASYRGAVADRVWKDRV